MAAELERRWNERLDEVRRHEERLDGIGADGAGTPSAAERERLLALGDDLFAAWPHPARTAETRMRILRAVLAEIVVKLREGRIDLLLHWHGGDHTRLAVPRNRTGQHRFRTDAETNDLVRALARQLPDGGVAAMLNRLGRRSGRPGPYPGCPVVTEGYSEPWSADWRQFARSAYACSNPVQHQPAIARARRLE